MGDQTQAYDIFQTPLSSGYPLPLSTLMPLLEKNKKIVNFNLVFDFQALIAKKVFLRIFADDIKYKI